MITFATFLREVRGVDPYPWQERLATCCAEGEPPAVLGLPTGSGKTTAVDALVWALAIQAERPAGKRTVGIRIVWAIDRRILVDEVHEHAQHLAALLAEANDDEAAPLHETAQRLARLSDGVPLVATRWRGGLGERPAREHPLQPQVITSTVAQVGSRLLFRGYGVGQRSLAVEGGLLGCDSTICLDEAHLVEPFRQTAAAIREQVGRAEHALGLPGVRTLTITATPESGEADVLALEDADRKALGSRLYGEKRARLLVPERSGEAARVQALVDATLAYLDDGAPTVACVANTVAAARSVFDKLQTAATRRGVVVALLIGPQRPTDREEQLSRIRPALLEGHALEHPVACVATQAFEVGIDADVAALVTESASASALVQRLGRLNRRGNVQGRATIVRDEGRWLYASDEPAAWEWLLARRGSDETVDVSVAALLDDSTRPAPRRVAHAPALTREVVELLVQTSPRPAPWCEPDIEAFLRGAESEPAADVAVCWRSDLRLDQTGPAAHGYRAMLLDLAPPDAQELLTLSISSARALIAARFGASEQRAALTRAAQADADLESEMTDPTIPEVRGGSAGEPFAVLRRGELQPGTLDQSVEGVPSPKPVRPIDLVPGDVVLLGTDAGGVDGFGLSPGPGHATDVSPDLRPAEAELPRSIRINPGVLTDLERPPTVAEAEPDQSRQARWLDASRRRWSRIAARCQAVEQILSDTRTSEANDRQVQKLLAALTRELPSHPGLKRLAEAGGEAPRLALRGVGPVDAASGFPVADRAELYEEDAPADDPDTRTETIFADAEESRVADDAWAGERGEVAGATSLLDATATDSPTEDPAAGPLGRAWVLVCLPPARPEMDKRTQASPPPSLDAHAAAVLGEVSEATRRLALPEVITAALHLAAAAHDHGKADHRIQAFYRRGAPAMGGEPIAKSEFGTADPRASGRAQVLAGLPAGLRHEIGSVAALADALRADPDLGDGLDTDLALALVASHHGLGRPVPQVPGEGAPPRDFSVNAAGVMGSATGDGLDGWGDGEWVRRFWDVTGRYGAWGGAYLEAILVLADRTVSARGS